MSSKALPPFRKNCRFAWWRFYIPAPVFFRGVASLDSLLELSSQSHIPFGQSFNFQGAVISPSTNRQKLKKICIVYEKIFWFNFLFIAVDYFRLSILDCWKNIGKLTPCYQFFLITRAENKKTPYEKQNRFLRSIFHTVLGIGILLFFAFQCISKSMLINVVSHIRLLPLFFLQ